MHIRHLVALALAAAVIGCGGEAKQKAQEAGESAKNTVKKVGAALNVSAPYDNQQEDRSVRERQRFDEQWRQLQSFREQQRAREAAAAAAAQPAALPAGFQFVTGTRESFKDLDVSAINTAPVNVPVTGDVRGPSVLRAQVYLDRMHMSVGSIDGRWGRNSAIAVWWYQRARGIEPTGDLDEPTFRKLAAEAAYAPVVTQYTVTAEDLKGPFVNLPNDVYEKAKLECLCYESVREELGEKFHVDPDFLDTLNPSAKWNRLEAGNTITVPNVRPPIESDQHDIAKVAISIAGNSLNGFDAAGRLVFHAPTTLGAGYDPSPTETLKVAKIIADPHFHYDPTLYHEVPDTDPDAMLSPGPNSPVGVVWIALSKEHYGIHGTNDPESIGYASSHGCVRLTNWDARELEHRISEGVTVSFADLRKKGMPEVAR